jgi:hypothetical protein
MVSRGKCRGGKRFTAENAEFAEKGFHNRIGKGVVHHREREERRERDGVENCRMKTRG